MIALLFSLVLSLALAFSAAAADATFEWGPNPAGETVAYYQVLDNGAVVWSGQGFSALIPLGKGAHVVTGRACSEFTNPDATKVTVCSGDSPAVVGSVPGASVGFHVKTVGGNLK